MSTPPPQSPSPAGGLLLGRPFGVPVSLSWSWFAFAALIAVLFAPIIEQRLPGIGSGYAVAVALCFAVLLGLSVLLHELAHSVAALRYGLRVRRITLHLLGGVSEIESESPRPGQDLVIAVVGPLASLLLAGAGLVLVRLLPSGTVVELVAWQLAITNLLVGLFNLLPGLPLDGGRILRDVVWAATGREHTGTVAAAWAGRLLAGVLVVVAVTPFLLGVRDLIWPLWGLFIAAFVWSEANRALQGARIRARLPALDVRALTRRAAAVEESLPLSEALRQLAASQAGGLVTVDTFGHPVGLVHEAAVAAVPEDRRPWVSVGSVSRRLTPEATVRSDVDGQGLVAHLSAHPYTEYLVVDERSAVYGVLSRVDVERALASVTRGR